jgi:hypothetical protein
MAEPGSGAPAAWGPAPAGVAPAAADTKKKKKQQDGTREEVGNDEIYFAAESLEV